MKKFDLVFFTLILAFSLFSFATANLGRAAKCNEEYKPTGAGDKFYWHYDKSSDACHFHRSNGIFDTNNYFEFRTTCMRTCKTKLYFKYFEKLKITPRKNRKCKRTFRPSIYKNQLVSFYYDKENDLCQATRHGRPGKYRNIFPTSESCKKACLTDKHNYKTLTDENSKVSTKKATSGSKRDARCNRTFFPSSLKSHVAYFYYDRKNDLCQVTHNGRLGQNKNIFPTPESCKKACLTDKHNYKVLPTKNEGIIHS